MRTNIILKRPSNKQNRAKRPLLRQYLRIYSGCSKSLIINFSELISFCSFISRNTGLTFVISRCIKTKETAKLLNSLLFRLVDRVTLQNFYQICSIIFFTSYFCREFSHLVWIHVKINRIVRLSSTRATSPQPLLKKIEDLLR